MKCIFYNHCLACSGSWPWLLAIGWALLFNTALAVSSPDTLTEYSIPSPLAVKSLLLDGAIIDRQLIVVGERGHILTSPLTNNTTELNWTQSITPTQATLTGVYFHNPQLGWAVGHDAIILRTQDAGKNWQRIYDDPQDERPLLDVWFKDAQHGFAVGAYGLFLQTQDGGNTWVTRQIIEEDFHFNHIAQADNGQLYITAEAGHLYRSDDQGQTWQALPSPYHGSFFGSLPLANKSLLIFGLRGQLYRSDDSGEHWHKIATGVDTSLTEGRYLNHQTVLIVGLGGTVLISHDQGQHFTLHQQSDRKGLTQALPIDNEQIILIGEAGIKSLKLPPSSPTDVP